MFTEFLLRFPNSHVSWRCPLAKHRAPLVYSGSICLMCTIFCTSLLEAEVFTETLPQLHRCTLSLHLDERFPGQSHQCSTRNHSDASVTETFTLRPRSCDRLNVASRLPEFKRTAFNQPCSKQEKRIGSFLSKLHPKMQCERVQQNCWVYKNVCSGGTEKLTQLFLQFFGNKDQTVSVWTTSWDMKLSTVTWTNPKAILLYHHLIFLFKYQR